MNHQSFELKLLDPHWICSGDQPDDLCAHGHVYLKIGEQVVSDYESADWTVSSAALSLLRTLTNDYVKDEYSNQLLPCCGFFLIADDEEESVIIQGCDTGIDWEIVHLDAERIQHTLENGYSAIIPTAIYRSAVLEFADEVEQFFINSQPKNLPTDAFHLKGYLTFWKEWHRLRDAWK